MKNNENFIHRVFRWVIDNILWDFVSFFSSTLLSGSTIWTHWDFLNLMDRFSRIYVFIIYFFLFFGFIHFLLNVYRLLFQKNRVLSLAEARTEGVQLRNRGEQLIDQEEGKLWIDEFDRWDRETIKKISKISKSKAEYFKVINRFHYHRGKLFSKGEIHNMKLNVLEEKLLRLEILIKELEEKKKF